MRKCPNCNAELEDNFELCWNCNYSLTEKKVIEIKDVVQGGRDIDCLRCKISLLYSGNFKFHEGSRVGLFGNLFEMFLNRESFDIYVCPKCGKVEFYTPQT